MSASWQVRPVAKIRSEFASKFGVPRQAGLVPELTATIEFEPEFRNPDAIRGIEGFSHLWLLWIFSENISHGWSIMSRPPRLGGNTKLGVFATRSPYRPNPIGQSVVKLLEVKTNPTALVVGGADLVDGTPIIDIKPYVKTDRIEDGRYGFTELNDDYTLEVEIPDEFLDGMGELEAAALRGVLAQNPIPQYQHDPDRIYGMTFSGRQIRFRVCDGKVTVVEISGLNADEANE